MSSSNSHRHVRFTLLTTAVMIAIALLSHDAAAQDRRRDSVIAAAREIMGAQTFCALVTIDSTGGPQARTMNPFPPDDSMIVWMATNSLSRKATELRMNDRVCLYYADHGKGTGYVAITGRAVLVDDMNEKLKRKRAYWDQAFPDWKLLLLIKVIPERIDVINYKYHMLNDSVTWKSPVADFH
jgi:general stress protein 26